MMKNIPLAIVMMAGLAATAPAAAQPGDAAKGAQLFRQSCRMCHGVEPGISRGGGPNLAGLTKDGPVAVDSTYDYSPSFKAAAAKGLVWSQKSLEDFLETPDRLVPETTMPIGVPTPGDRADMVAYLLTLKKD